MIAALLVAAGGLSALVWQARRRPAIFRLAARSATRRPGESALVVCGSLLGAAIITGSFIVGDTLQSSIQATAFSQLGPVDEVVSVPRGKEGAEVRARLKSLDTPAIDGVMTARVLPVAAAALAGGNLVGEPRAQVIEMDLSAARGFGGDPRSTGIEGPTPANAEAVITEPLATTLRARAGDEITLYIYGSPIELRVDRVFPQKGLAGLWLGIESHSPNVFVRPGTIQRTLDRVRDRGTIPEAKLSPPEDLVLISNSGGVLEGADHTAAAVRDIEEALGNEALRADPVKSDRLRDAEDAGSQFAKAFLSIGTFAVIAGVLLLVNVFVMLADERRSQLGMMRAMGMKRSDMVRSFLMEGIMYSLVANVVGAGLGIAVGWAIVAVAAPIFSSASDVFSLQLILDAEPDSVAAGFVAGTLICMGAIATTSVRISRTNVIRAIRELPEPAPPGSRRRAIAVGAAVALLGIGWFAFSVGSARAWTGSILGIPMLLFGLAPGLSRLTSRRVALSAAAMGTLLWGVFGDRILDGGFFDYGRFVAFVIQGLLLTLSAVLLLSFNQEALARMLSPLTKRALSLRLGLAYPLAKRFRTAMTLGMFALVIFTMTLLLVLSSVFAGQVETFTERASGGFDIVASSASSSPPRRVELDRVDGVEAVSVLRYGVPLFATESSLIPQPWPASGIDEAFVGIGPPDLDDMLQGMDDDEVWQMVLDDPSTTVIPSVFLEGGGAAEVFEPGDILGVVDPATGEVFRRKIIGIVGEDPGFSGALMSRRSIGEIMGTKATASRFLIDSAGGRDEAVELSERLQGSFLSRGLEAQTFRAVVEEAARVPLQILRLMQGYLALGLIVGIAGLGVVMIRAVRDRRREIGVLRSIGAVGRQIRGAFLFESAFVALEGIVAGSALAIVTASQLISTGGFGEGIAFDVPWGQVTWLCAGTLVASVLAALWPAARAAATPPAVALRIAD